MSALRKKYLMNQDAVDNGAPFVMAVNDDGSQARAWLRRIGTSENEYQRVLAKLMEPHRREQELGVLPKEKLDAIIMQAFCEGAIAKWENVPWDDVMPDAPRLAPAPASWVPGATYAPYTADNALLLLKPLPELYNDMRAFAFTRENYLQATVEVDAKN